MAFTDSNTASCTIAAKRAWANGFWPFAIAVFTAITFQSNTTSARAKTDPNNRVAVNMHIPRVLFLGAPCIHFISFLLILHRLSVSRNAVVGQKVVSRRSKRAGTALLRQIRLIYSLLGVCSIVLTSRNQYD